MWKVEVGFREDSADTRWPVTIRNSTWLVFGVKVVDSVLINMNMKWVET